MRALSDPRPSRPVAVPPLLLYGTLLVSGASVHVDREPDHDPGYLARLHDLADGGEIAVESSPLQRTGRQRDRSAGIRDRQSDSLAAVIDTQCAGHAVEC